MVKAALTRAGVSYSSEKTLGADKAGKNIERKAADIVAPRPMSVPPPVIMAPPVAPPESISMEDMEGLVEEVSLRPAPVKMEGGAPLAFGNLMESTVEEDPGFVSPVHPELAVERDWRAKEEEDDVPEEEEEEEPKASWRRDADVDEVAEGVTGAVRDWRDTAFSEPPTRKSAREDWAATESVPAMTEAAATKESTTAILQEAPAAAVTAVHPAAIPETIPQVPAFPADAWASAISVGEPAGVGASHAERAASQVLSENGVHTLTAVETPAAESDVATREFPAAATLAVEHDAVATAIDRFAGSRDAHGEADGAVPTATSAWETQAMKASLLAATWDAPVAEVAAPETTAAEPAIADVAVSAEVAPSAPEISEAAAVEEVSEAVAADEPVTTQEVVDAGHLETIAEAPAEVAAPVATETQEIVHEQHAAESETATEDAIAPIPETAASAELVTAPVHAEIATETAANEAPVEAIQTGESLGVAQEVETQHVEAQDVAQNEFHEEAVSAPTETAVEHEDRFSDVAAITESVVESAYAGEPPAIETASENLTGPVAAPEVAVATESKTAHEDVVARVLASLSPEVMQAVTRELLKPVVEAMVREELNKKK